MRRDPPVIHGRDHLHGGPDPIRIAYAIAGLVSLPMAFAGRISSDQTLTKNATVPVVFDSLTTNDPSVFTGLDGGSENAIAATSGVYLVFARVEYNVVNDGTHELVVPVTWTGAGTPTSRVIRSDYPGQDQRFSKDTFYPLTLSTWQFVDAGGNDALFGLQHISTGATVDATGRGRLHIIRLGDVMT